jgi:hypothetical protein
MKHLKYLAVGLGLLIIVLATSGIIVGGIYVIDNIAGFSAPAIIARIVAGLFFLYLAGRFALS